MAGNFLPGPVHPDKPKQTCLQAILLLFSGCQAIALVCHPTVCQWQTVYRSERKLLNELLGLPVRTPSVLAPLLIRLPS